MEQNKKKVLMWLCLWMMVLSSGYAQVTGNSILVKGKIVDREDRSEVIGATIYVGSKGVSSNVEGEFEVLFSDIDEKKEVQLVVQSMGYKKMEKTIVLNADTVRLGTLVLIQDNLLQDIEVFSNYVENTRAVPITVSTVTSETIDLKLGAQDLPELIKSVPGVYVSKSGGNAGGSRMVIRGFTQENIGVAINGIPVNDMENGRVYWSNFGALGDFTKSQQVQKGLGASKLAINSVGGTVNTITHITDPKMNGNFSASYGSNNNILGKLNFSTGLLPGDWAANVGFVYQQNDGYVDHTFSRSYAYFAALSKKINENHMLSITVFGAPQENNQRSTQIQGSLYEQVEPNHNLNYGDGVNERRNTFHKPFLSVNHSWSINQEMSLQSALYYSSGRGYGTEIQGDQFRAGSPFFFTEKGKLGNRVINRNGEFMGTIAAPYNNGNNQIAFNDIIAYNSGQANPFADYGATMNTDQRALFILKRRHNEHDWVGGISTFKWDITDQLTWMSGGDIRYYQGRHYESIDNLLGANYYLDGSNGRPDPATQLKKGDIIGYDNRFDIFWLGLFTQLEYRNEYITTFLTVSGSDTFFQRRDYWNSETPITPWRDRLGLNTKTGIGWNIDAYSNLYLNGGFFTKAPYVTTLYNNNQTYLGQVKNEKIYSTELGYGFNFQKLRIGLSTYYTLWADRSQSESYTENKIDYRGIAYGINQQHYGIELEASYAPWKYLQLNGSFSMGNWTYAKNARANMRDEQSGETTEITYYLKGLKVADAAQLTAFLGIQSEVWKGLYIGLDANYFDRIYARYDVSSVANNEPTGLWRLPGYYTLDAQLGWRNIPLAHRWYLSIIGNVYNLTDNRYINEATNGVNNDQASSAYFYGQNISYLLTMRVNFK